VCVYVCAWVCRVLVFGGSGGRASHILELRTWRLQPVGLLSSERQHMVSQQLCVGGLCTASVFCVLRSNSTQHIYVCSQCQLQPWACLEPATDDGLPCVGAAAAAAVITQAGVTFENKVLSLGGVNEHEVCRQPACPPHCCWRCGFALQGSFSLTVLVGCLTSCVSTLYLFHLQEYVDVMECYDDTTGQWTVVGRMPCPMSHLAVTGANVSTSGLTKRISGSSGGRRRASSPGMSPSVLNLEG
jgi:hypothetical protein